VLLEAFTQLLTAITGKSAGKYNGKYGEVGVKAHRAIAHYWFDFFKEHIKVMTMEQFNEFLDVGKCLQRNLEPLDILR
jgi:hypothetical protein